MRLFHIITNRNVESILKRGVSGVYEVQWLGGVYHGVPLSNEALECRMGRLQRPFDYSHGFRFGGGYPPFRDTQMAIYIPENVVSPYEVTSDGRLNGHSESLHRQFIAPALVLDYCDESQLTIVGNESSLSSGS